MRRPALDRRPSPRSPLIIVALPALGIKFTLGGRERPAHQRERAPGRATPSTADFPEDRSEPIYLAIDRPGRPQAQASSPQYAAALRRAAGRRGRHAAAAGRPEHLADRRLLRRDRPADPDPGPGARHPRHPGALPGRGRRPRRRASWTRRPAWPRTCPGRSC